jgi:hypothetical protein
MFSRKLFSATLVPSFVLSSVAIVFAQLGTAGISGLVSDTNGAAIANARVIVKHKATGQTHGKLLQAARASTHFRTWLPLPTRFESKRPTLRRLL